MLCIAGMDGYFKRLNPAWEKILGYTRKELIVAAVPGFRPPRGRAQDHRRGAEGLQPERDVVQFENRYRAKDGSYRWLVWNCHARWESSIYAAAHDITERKQQRAGHRTRPPDGGGECRAASRNW